ncbi:hypothetical protein GCM10011321_31340 [Youhaiella tibetensis]|uniref:Late control D family protein n=1 Tax=Paradevosia tibetensis TaxID=1447062 RepID=A0A5B9DIE2_9HYPH|nr:late control D family protein [Youhaiella tibetensis]QEE18904.1 late control D family protein [Youhaiella tibetensis]GGF38145.1 hypothetical protein GCM10011321_31340 [Youhaiella tibetensis]
MVWKVDWEVSIDGRNLTSKWASVLIDIEVTDKAGATSDACSLTIDDTGGQIRLPREGQRLVVRLQGRKVFEGFIEQPQSSGSRNGGRILKIKAKSADTAGKAKEPQNFHTDDATLGEFLGDAAKRAGLDLAIDPSFASVRRDYWSAEGESFFALGERWARRLGGTFKIRGDRAVLARRGEATSPSGSALAAVAAIVGVNVIKWDITPRDPRRTFKSGTARWFDRAAAKYKSTGLEFDGDDPGDADNVARFIMADEDEAGEHLDARKRESKREAGSGTVELDLTVDAVAEGQMTIENARAGVDGTYRIESVKHKASRGGGATTTLELKEPAGGAGKDKRGAPDFALPRSETLG